MWVLVSIFKSNPLYDFLLQVKHEGLYFHLKGRRLSKFSSGKKTAVLICSLCLLQQNETIQHMWSWLCPKPGETCKHCLTNIRRYSDISLFCCIQPFFYWYLQYCKITVHISTSIRTSLLDADVLLRISSSSMSLTALTRRSASSFSVPAALQSF